MKYWLKKPGTSEFSGPHTLSEINAQIQAGKVDWDFEALEANGQSLGTLKRSVNWIPLTSILVQQYEQVIQPQQSIDEVQQPRMNTTHQGQSPLAFLEMTRSRTCYSALRDMISLFSIFSIIAIVLLAGFSVMAGVQNSSGTSVIIGIAVGVLGCFVTIATKQASFLLIDIADTLIEQNRQKSQQP